MLPLSMHKDRSRFLGIAWLISLNFPVLYSFGQHSVACPSRRNVLQIIQRGNRLDPCPETRGLKQGEGI